jgi:hypothetical protein
MYRERQRAGGRRQKAEGNKKGESFSSNRVSDTFGKMSNI